MDPTNPTPPVRLDALNEQEGTATTTSPTGTPKVAPNIVPWLQGALGGLSAAAAAYVLHGHDENMKLVCVLVVAALGGIIGTASPGNRSKDGAQ